MHYSAKHGLAIACRLSVRLSVTLMDHDHIGWKSWKLIARTISPTSSLFVAGEHGKILERKCSFNTYVHNVRLNWVNRESRHLRRRCGCLLLSAHRAVVFCDSTAFLLLVTFRIAVFCMSLMNSLLVSVITEFDILRRFWCRYQCWLTERAKWHSQNLSWELVVK